MSVASPPSFQLKQIKMKYALGAALFLQSSLALGELLPVHFKAPTTAHFRDIVRNDTYDFGEGNTDVDTPVTRDGEVVASVFEAM